MTKDSRSEDLRTATQVKTFSRWCSQQLEPVGVVVEDVRVDFRTGIKLVQLLEQVGKKPIADQWKTGNNRFKHLENVNFALQYIKGDLGIRLESIHSEQIVDGHEKMTLGLVWSIILRFLVEGTSGDASGSRRGLIAWAQRHTRGYQGVWVGNFHRSWVDGLAFAALLNVFRPEELDYEKIDSRSNDKSVHLRNMTAALDGFKKIGVPVLLDADQVVGPLDDPTYRPDEKSILTQVAELYHFFTMERAERLIAKAISRIPASDDSLRLPKPGAWRLQIPQGLERLREAARKRALEPVAAEPEVEKVEVPLDTEGPVKFGPCYVEKVPAGKVLLVGVMKSGKSTLVNALFGYQLAKDGVGNRTTIARTKYRVPESQVTLIDTMGIETKNTEETLARSVRYVERCARRLDPSAHVCAGILAISGSSLQYQDIDGDVALTFRQANVPLVIGVTHVIEEGALLLANDIKEDPYFAGIDAVLVNSVASVSRSGKVLAEASGLDELAAKLEVLVAEGKTRAKPNALYQIGILQGVLLGAATRLQADAQRREEGKQVRASLTKDRPVVPETEGLLRKISQETDGLVDYEGQLHTLGAKLHENLTEIQTRVQGDVADLGTLEVDIRNGFHQLALLEHWIRQAELKIWSAELSYRELLAAWRPAATLKDAEEVQTKFAELKYGNPIIISADAVPADFAEERAKITELAATVEALLAKKTELIAAIEGLQYTSAQLQSEWDAGEPLREFDRAVRDLQLPLEQIRAREGQYASDSKERQRAVEGRIAARKAAKETYKAIRALVNAPRGLYRSLTSQAEQAAAEADRAEVVKVEKDALLELIAGESHSLIDIVADAQPEIVNLEKEIYRRQTSQAQKKESAGKLLAELIQVTDKLKAAADESAAVEKAVAAKLVSLPKEAQAAFEAAIKLREAQAADQLSQIGDRLALLEAEAAAAAKAAEERARALQLEREREAEEYEKRLKEAEEQRLAELELEQQLNRERLAAAEAQARDEQRRAVDDFRNMLDFQSLAYEETVARTARQKEALRVFNAETATMVRDAEAALVQFERKAKAKEIGKNHRDLVQKLVEIFQLQDPQAGEAILNKTKLGGEANFRKGKAVFERGDPRARLVTGKFGKAVIGAFQDARYQAGPENPLTTAAVLALIKE